MPFAVNKYVEETRPGKLDFPDGSTLNFKYRPNAYTPRHEKIVQDIRNELDSTAGDILKASLIPLLESWDVVIRTFKAKARGEKHTLLDEYEDVPVPITDEGLDVIPIKVLGDIIRKIGEGVSPGEATGGDSTGSFG